MRLLVHIGTPKTGTTSIQSMLGNNREILARHGICYPNVDGSNAHNLLPAAFRSPQTHWAYRRKLYGNDPGRIVQAAQKAWERVFASAGEATHQTLVLSSEGFSLLDGTQALKALLKDRLPGITPEIVVYLRHPVDWVQSILFQRLRRTTEILPPMPFGWGDMLSRWAEVGTLSIRSMERDHLINGDAVSDFVTAVLGLDPSDLRDQSVKRNQSLSAEGAILFHDYCRLIQPDRNEVRTDELRALIKELMKIEDRPDLTPQKSKILLRPEWRELVVSRFSGDMKRILRQHDFRFSDSALYGDQDPGTVAKPLEFRTLREVIIDYDPDLLTEFQARLTGALLSAQFKHSHQAASHGLPEPMRRLIWSGLRRIRMLKRRG